MIGLKQTLATCLMVTGLVAASSMMSTPTFAEKFSSGDMGKCLQKFTVAQGFKDKMCACKDSACAQFAEDLAIAPVVRVRPTVVPNHANFLHLAGMAR
jgi:hypothetical protein